MCSTMMIGGIPSYYYLNKMYGCVFNLPLIPYKLHLPVRTRIYINLSHIAAYECECRMNTNEYPL